MILFEKLCHIQQELKAPKNLKNTFGKYNYRNAEGILEALKPYLGKYKVMVTLSDSIEEVGGRVYVKATASIHDTENDGSTLFVTAYAREAMDKKGMDDSQITGTASSYARKYALNGLFLLDDTKDADSDEYKNEREQRAEKASVTHVKNLQALAEALQKEGIKNEFVMKLYKVDSFMDLTDKQIDNIGSHIAEIKARQEAE